MPRLRLTVQQEAVRPPARPPATADALVLRICRVCDRPFRGPVDAQDEVCDRCQS